MLCLATICFQLIVVVELCQEKEEQRGERSDPSHLAAQGGAENPVQLHPLIHHVQVRPQGKQLGAHGRGV